MQPSSFLFSLSPSPETSPKLPIWGELNCFIQRLLVVGWGKSQPFIHLPFPTMNSSSDSTETPLAKKRLTMQRFCVCVCMLNHFSHVQLCEAIWDAAHQAPLYMEFSRQEYWSGLPFTYLGDWACIHCLWNFTLIFITCVTLLLADNLILLNLSTLICKLDDFDCKD